MRLVSVLPWLCGLFSLSLAQSNSTQWPVHDDGFTDRLKWDHYSFMIDGQRTFVWSGEFHPWRIPVPEVWQDILQKIKSAGFNAVSIYLHWGFHAPNPETVDMETGSRNIDRLLKMCQDAGLFVTLRNGPYVNAETTAGGFALWTIDGSYGALRNNDPRYTAAWGPFMSASNEISGKHQFAVGGSVIMQQLENEIGGQRLSNGDINHVVADYMVELEDNARDHHVTSPLLTNAPNMQTLSWSKDFRPGLGAQDLYGVDSYPACWSCNLSECGTIREFTTVNYFPHFELVSPTQPSFIPEFQGGSYNPWAGPQGGCGGPGTLLDVDFVNVFYRDLAAQRITMISLYMLYGGTNWGGLATNLVSTSYDYSAPIRETRELQDKYSETKLVGLFFRTAHDLTKTDRRNLTSSLSSNPLVGASELRNPDTGAAFYAVRHIDSADKTISDFTLNVTTKSGSFVIPKFSNPIRLAGRQSKFVVTDFTFGHNTLLYSTAEPLSHSVVDGESVLTLWVPDGESGEFAILGGSKKRSVISGTGGSFHQVGDNLVVAWKSQAKAQGVLQFDNFRVLLLSRTLAYKFWAPTLTNNPIVSANDVVFVTGPYLVRTIAYHGSTAVITGDISNSTILEVWAPSNIHAISWNGKDVKAQRTSYGTLKATLAKPSFTAESLQSSLKLGDWKYSDSVPESAPSYDDSHWVVADKTSSPNPRKLTTPVSLYADDYGFHTGVQIFRGRFDGKGASGVLLHLQGGTAFGWSAWLNGVYLGSFPGVPGVPDGTLDLSFAGVALSDSGNVLTIAMDHSGHDQRGDALLPRGILDFTLHSGSNASVSIKEWRLAGNAGGESNIDPMRGVIHEGGLHAERLGWHLPGFDDSQWDAKDVSEGVPGGRMGFFRTTTEFDIPVGYDAYVQVVLTAPKGSLLRALLYVNGYQYGKFVPQIGNAVAFPVPPGILNYRGSNTIGLNVWSQSNDTATVTAEWDVVGVYESSFGNFDGTYLQPGWTEDRLQWA
ncbi:glycoside hydrolase superfamily [Mycena rebaudengoi]|nr:glycoside hydrolase superfamily [Mycena rebaudengoi]